MAITSNENLISNSSYTEKDFQVIYPALLDLVKKLTSKWDPSASNESDPGVILLKLNALIADKCNYNIDKNVLECFPLSVTQESNARQLFEQLGYYMHWYRGAETTIAMKYTGDTIVDSERNIVSYKIPRFTMICDQDSEVVYTITEEKTLKTDGTIQTFNAVQGIVVEYDTNGETLITTSNLDSNNRLYFTDQRVAENGIFIKNAGDSVNYLSWKKKDNLLYEELSSSNCFYKFGVSQDLKTCYLEFPENAEELFQDGINITYIKTSGADGNTSAYSLTQFYSDLEVDNPLSPGETIQLTTETVGVKNYYAGIGGLDPETIDEAYKGYKKTVGTFKTLVTLRDYMNAISSSEYVSNALVCDRTTDPQSSYDIMTQLGSINQLMNEVELTDKHGIYGYFDGENFWEKKTEDGSKVTYEGYITPDVNSNYFDIDDANASYRVFVVNGESTYLACDAVDKPALEAFDLKLYLLSATGVINDDVDAYNTSFVLDADEITTAVVEAELDENKLIQHNVSEILENKICFIKDKYPINCTIIPQYALTEAQADEISKNIRIALYNNLNSSEIEFGAEIPYETIYNLILNADSRIKAVALDRLDYSTYVVYLDSEDHKIKEACIDKLITNTEGEIITDDVRNKFRIEIYAKSVLAGRTQFFIKDTTFDFGINQRYQLWEKNIGRFDTNVNIEFSKEKSWEYTIRDNETIQMYAPNLIAEADYSKDMRYEYSIHNKVDADSSYMLHNNEYVAFYRASDDDVNSGFICDIYGEGAIIHPSFAMEASDVSKTTSLICVKFGLTNRTDGTMYYIEKKGYWACIGKNSFDISKTVEGQSLGDAINTLVGSANTLSNNRKIELMLTNSVLLDSTADYCYWVLNDTSKKDGRYYLFTEDTGYERILKSGEYFIYTDSNKADMNILGAGTKITREFTEDFSVEAMDYSKIVDEGLTALENKWKQLDSGHALDVSEMQYSIFSDGTIVNIEPISDETTFGPACKIEYYITRDITGGADVQPTTLLDGEYIVMYYKLASEIMTDCYQVYVYGKGTQVLPSYTIEKSKSRSSKEEIICWELIDELQPTLDIYSRCEFEITKGLYPVMYDEVTAYSLYIKEENAVKTSVRLTKLHLDSFTPTPLYNCNIKYRQSVNDAWTTLPSITLGSSTSNWQAITTLRMNVSSATPQEIREGQQVYYYYYDTENQCVIIPTEEEKQQQLIDPTIPPWKDEEHPEVSGVAYLMTSKLINSVGGENVSTIYYDTNKNPIPIEIYAYVLGTMTDDVKILDDGSTQVMFRGKEGVQPEKTQTQIVTFRLPKGDYIMPVSHSTDENIIEKLFLYLDRGNIKSYNVTYTYYFDDIIKGTVITLENGESLPTENIVNNAVYLKYNEKVDPDPATIKATVANLTELKNYSGVLLLDDIIKVTKDSTQDDYTSFYKCTKPDAEGMDRFEFLSSKKPYFDGYSQHVHTGSEWVNSSTRLTKDEQLKFNGDFYYKYINEVPSSGYDTKKFVTDKTVWEKTLGDLLYPMGVNEDEKTEKDANMAEAGNYYLRIDELNDSTDVGSSSKFFVTVTVELTYISQPASAQEQPVVSVLIPPIFKYSNSEALATDKELNSQLFILIYEKLKELDYHRLFNYTYVVNDDEKIEDPLKSSAFLNTNHILNPATICQIDTGNTQIYITNKLKG